MGHPFLNRAQNFVSLEWCQNKRLGLCELLTVLVIFTVGSKSVISDNFLIIGVRRCPRNRLAGDKKASIAGLRRGLICAARRMVLLSLEAEQDKHCSVLSGLVGQLAEGCKVSTLSLPGGGNGCCFPEKE